MKSRNFLFLSAYVFLLIFSSAQANSEVAKILFTYDLPRSEAEFRSSLKTGWTKELSKENGGVVTFTDAIPHELVISIDGKTASFKNMFFIGTTSVSNQYESITDGSVAVSLSDAIHLAEKYSSAVKSLGKKQSTRKFDEPLRVIPLLEEMPPAICKSFDELKLEFIKIRNFQASSNDKYKMKSHINANIGIWRDNGVEIAIQIQARPNLYGDGISLKDEKIYFVSISVLKYN